MVPPSLHDAAWGSGSCIPTVAMSTPTHRASPRTSSSGSGEGASLLGVPRGTTEGSRGAAGLLKDHGRGEECTQFHVKPLTLNAVPSSSASRVGTSSHGVQGGRDGDCHIDSESRKRRRRHLGGRTGAAKSMSAPARRGRWSCTSANPVPAPPPLHVKPGERRRAGGKPPLDHSMPRHGTSMALFCWVWWGARWSRAAVRVGHVLVERGFTGNDGMCSLPASPLAHEATWDVDRPGERCSSVDRSLGDRWWCESR